MTFEDHKKSLEEHIEAAIARERAHTYLEVLAFVSGVIEAGGTMNLTRHLTDWLQRKVAQS